MGPQRLQTYLRLIHSHDSPEFRPHLELLKRRFECGLGQTRPAWIRSLRPRPDPAKHLREQNVLTATALLLQDYLKLPLPVAQLVATKLGELHDRLYAHAGRLAPGQTILLVDSAASAPKYAGQRCDQRPLVPVVLSPWTDDKRELLLSDRPLSEKRASVADALAREAQAQGGTMTISILAMLLGTSQSTLAAALATLRCHQDEPTPIKGITEDAGATLTHKDLICDLHDQGRTPPEISHVTCHSPESRDRYLKTNLRVETLTRVLRHIPDEVRAARFLGIQKSVVKQYLDRLNRRRAAD
jgi:hypothetical protein